MPASTPSVASFRVKLLLSLLSTALLLTWGGLAVLVGTGHVRFQSAARVVRPRTPVPVACPAAAPQLVQVPCDTAAAPTAPARPATMPAAWAKAHSGVPRQAWPKMAVRQPLAQPAATPAPIEPAETTTVVLAGRILDANGEPLVGATAAVKGTTQVVSTDAAGHYQLEAAVGSTVVYGYGGYEDAEILVGHTSRLDAMLLPAETPRRRKL